mgnify:CR=1 FL=1
MRTIQFFMFIGVFLLSKGVKGQQVEGDEQQLRRLEVEWKDCLDKGDTISLKKMWSKDYIVNNPNGKISTRNDILAQMRAGQKYPSIQRNIESVTFNQGLGVVMGNEVAQVPTNGVKFVRRFMNIWIKTDEGWKLAARQATNHSTTP